MPGQGYSRAAQLRAEIPADECDSRTELKYYLRNAWLILRKAEAYNRDGDLEWEYKCLWRFACLVLEVIPHHEGYRRPSQVAREQTKRLKEQAKLALSRIEKLQSEIDQATVPLSAQPKGPRGSVPYDPFAKDQSVLELSGVAVEPQRSNEPMRLPDGRLDLLSNETVIDATPSAGTTGRQDEGNKRIDVDPSLREKHALGFSLESIGEAGKEVPPSSTGDNFKSRPDGTRGEDTWTRFDSDEEGDDDIHEGGEILPNGKGESEVIPPQRELDVPPQRAEVLEPRAPQLGEESCECSVPSVGLAEQKELEQRLGSEQGLSSSDTKPKSLHVSTHLMDTFMRLAELNTQRNLETCAILAGEMRHGVFLVTTLIVPKQTATANSVTAMNEEEIFAEQDSRELFSLGWIHTHPRQACFLSSIDLHTHCAYQTMLEEAVAIVMAPTDTRQKYGIFQLTVPDGLKTIQQCPYSGFHAHDNLDSGRPIYEHSTHVYFNASVGCQVLDLRS